MRVGPASVIWGCALAAALLLLALHRNALPALSEAADRIVVHKQAHSMTLYRGDTMIHGIRNGWGWLRPLQRKIYGTKGCIAVTDPGIDQLWIAVPDGTRIEIDP